MVEIKQITTPEQIDAFVADLKAAQWDAGNEIEIENYSPDSVAAFVQHDRSLLIAAYIDGNFAGMTAATAQTHIHNSGTWLYVDEVDTAVNHRRKGVGRAMMEWLFAYAKQHGYYEVALGTERDNNPARGLYESLKPSDTEDVIWYMYDMDEVK